MRALVIAAAVFVLVVVAIVVAVWLQPEILTKFSTQPTFEPISDQQKIELRRQLNESFEQQKQVSGEEAVPQEESKEDVRVQFIEESEDSQSPDESEKDKIRAQLEGQ